MRFCKRRDDRDQQLQDNLSRNIRVDAHGQNGEVRDSTTRQQVQDAEEVASGATCQDGGETSPVYPGTGTCETRR
jgi:hypothetical protein